MCADGNSAAGEFCACAHGVSARVCARICVYLSSQLPLADHAIEGVVLLHLGGGAQAARERVHAVDVRNEQICSREMTSEIINNRCQHK